jgi:hypothetical protein
MKSSFTQKRPVARLPPVTTSGTRRASPHEAVLWEAIERAWAALGAPSNRVRLALRYGEAVDTNLVDRILKRLMQKLRQHLESLDSKALAVFDQVLDRKLYELDRRDVHSRVGGSNDGFLYARCFVVAMGYDYYEAVLHPVVVPPFADCEALCYLSTDEHEQRFGIPPPPSGISRETRSNAAGWRAETT